MKIDDDDDGSYVLENESESDSKSLVASLELSEKDNESDTNGEHAENIEGYKNENTGVIPTTSKEKFTIGVGSVKLYPPWAKASKETWLQHGGFKKDDKRGILLKDKVFCKYCNNYMKYLNSPSNLMNS